MDASLAGALGLTTAYRREMVVLQGPARRAYFPALVR